MKTILFLISDKSTTANLNVKQENNNILSQCYNESGSKFNNHCFSPSVLTISSSFIVNKFNALISSRTFVMVCLAMRANTLRCFIHVCKWVSRSFRFFRTFCVQTIAELSVGLGSWSALLCQRYMCHTRWKKNNVIIAIKLTSLFCRAFNTLTKQTSLNIFLEILDVKVCISMCSIFFYKKHTIQTNYLLSTFWFIRFHVKIDVPEWR